MNARYFVRGARRTVFTLFGGLAIGLLAGSLTFELLPGSDVNDVKLGHAAIAALPAIAGLFAGGAAWGAQMGRLAGIDDRRRMLRAGVLGFGPITFALAFGLGLAEPAVVGAFGGELPIHRVFTVLFTTSALLIAGVSGWALAWGLQRKDRWTFALRVGLSAASAFLFVNLVMEASGWVVGAPGAAERATMMVVMLTGNLAAAIVAGGVAGITIARQ